MFAGLMTDQILIRRVDSVSQDELGVQKRQWTDLTTVPGSFQPVRVTEKVIWDRLSLQVDAKVYVYATVDVTERDRIVHDGVEYKVVGVEKWGDVYKRLLVRRVS